MLAERAADRGPISNVYPAPKVWRKCQFSRDVGGTCRRDVGLGCEWLCLERDGKSWVIQLAIFRIVKLYPLILAKSAEISTKVLDLSHFHLTLDFTLQLSLHVV